MRTILRLVAFGCAATGSLAFASTVLAKTPQLLVTGATATGASAETTVDVKGAKEDAASAAVSIFVPIGYSANLSQPAGTQIGTVAARAQVLEISADAVIDVTGTILVGDKSSPALQVAAARCTGTPAHAAFWLLHLVASGQSVDVPVFVDPTTGSQATFSSAKFVLCLPQPYAKALPNYSPNGIKIIEAKAVLSAGVLTNPTSAGSLVWRSLVTPWAVSGTAPNLAGTTESQSIVTIPSSLSLKAKVRTVRHRRHGRTRVTNSVLLSGKLLENLQGIVGAKVAFFAGSRSAGSTTTSAGGAFVRTNRLPRKTSFRATATVPTRETECVSPLPATAAPAGCVSATFAGYKIGSNTVAVRPRRR